MQALHGVCCNQATCEHIGAFQHFIVLQPLTLVCSLLSILAEFIDLVVAQERSGQCMQAQEMASAQSNLQTCQRECKKSQQLLRQLERQLAKGHMSRKDAAAASQQLQVRRNVNSAHAHASVRQCRSFVHMHALNTSIQKAA